MVQSKAGKVKPVDEALKTTRIYTEEKDSIGHMQGMGTYIKDI